MARFFSTGSTAGIRADHAERLRLILAQLNAAGGPRDMALPGLRLHPLRGRLRGWCAVNVSGNWRVVFRFEGVHAVDADYLDYH